MIATLDMIARAGLVQLRHPVRSWRPRRCCACKALIRRGERHISAWVLGRRGWPSDRRIHYACPAASDTFPPYTPADRFVESLNAWLAPVAALLAGAGIWVVVVLLARL